MSKEKPAWVRSSRRRGEAEASTSILRLWQRAEEARVKTRRIEWERRRVDLGNLALPGLGLVPSWFSCQRKRGN